MNVFHVSFYVVSSIEFCSDPPLQFALKRTATLPCIAGLQFRPRTHRARLYAQITLPPVFGFEVAHSLDLVFPSIPHRHVRKSVAGHHETLCAVLCHEEWDESVAFGRGWSVHPVGLTGEGKRRGFFREGLRGADFVDVRRGLEAFDRSFVNVL